jgi:hypothetical protein
MAALANQYGVRRSTISDLLKRSAVPIREQRQLEEHDLTQAITLYTEDWPLARIGAHLGFDAETIRQKLKQHNVEMRSPHRSSSIQ